MKRSPSATPADEDDIRCVTRQLGRVPYPVSLVAARCPWGLPAVVECLPATPTGTPFPTLFYCTCPTLVAAVAALESAGGVDAWSRRLTGSPELTASLAAVVAASRKRRAELVATHGLTMIDAGSSLASGVGGVADPRKMKCLHAHVALALAWPDYRLGAAILAEVDDLWCGDERCRVGGSGDAAAGSGPRASRP